MKKLSYLIIIALILGLILTGCSLLSNIGQAPATEQSGITYLTKGLFPNLVALWHFDESDGTIAPDSSGTNDGTLTNMDDLTCWVSGMFGQALSFDGGDDYVDLGNNVFSNVNLAAYTFEAWIKIASLDGVERRIFDDEGGLRPDLSSANRLRAVHWDGAVRIVEWATSPSVDTWYYVVQRYDGSYLRLYINGSEVGNPVSCGAWTPDSYDRAVRIGASWHPTSGRHWKGLIDEVRIWDRALSGAEIAYNYSLREIEIDIKPGSDPNSINLGSHGVVPVAILSLRDFDAAKVNPSTVTLSGAGVKRKGNSGSLEDVNGDGFLDLVVQVCTDDFALTAGATEAVLNAYTYAGLAITGSDWIKIVPLK